MVVEVESKYVFFLILEELIARLTIESSSSICQENINESFKLFERWALKKGNGNNANKPKRVKLTSKKIIKLQFK